MPLELFNAQPRVAMNRGAVENGTGRHNSTTVRAARVAHTAATNSPEVREREVV